jgi:hypothetical protein
VPERPWKSADETISEPEDKMRDALEGFKVHAHHHVAHA